MKISLDISFTGIKMTNRYLCTVLEELRKAGERLSWVTLPIGKRHISSLVEEVQTLANKMEAGLRDKKDFYRYTKDAGELGMSLKEYVDYLKERKEELRDEKAELEQQSRLLKKQIERRKFQLARLECDACQVWEYCPEHPDPHPDGGFEGLGALFG